MQVPTAETNIATPAASPTPVVSCADVNIESLPRRRTDYARILDRSQHTIKLYTSDGGTKLLRRPDGKVERQYRLNVGSLPVAYTSDKPAGADEPDLLYIMDRAVTSYNRDGEHGRRERGVENQEGQLVEATWAQGETSAAGWGVQEATAAACWQNLHCAWVALCAGGSLAAHSCANLMACQRIEPFITQQMCATALAAASAIVVYPRQASCSVLVTQCSVASTRSQASVSYLHSQQPACLLAVSASV